MASEAYTAQVAATAARMRAVSAPSEGSPGAVTKLSPESVSYRPSASCEHCLHWVDGGVEEDTGTCTLVSGTINGDWVCAEFSRAGGSSGGGQSVTLSMWS